MIDRRKQMGEVMADMADLARKLNSLVEAMQDDDEVYTDARGLLLLRLTRARTHVGEAICDMPPEAMSAMIEVRPASARELPEARIPATAA